MYFRIIAFVIFILAFTGVSSCSARNSPSKRATESSGELCKLQWSKNLPSWFPLIWNTTSIIYPEKVGNNEQWEIIVQSTFSSINIGCSDNSNLLSQFNEPTVELTCQDGNLKVGDESVSFANLGCRKQLTERVIKTGSCLTDKNFDKIQIQFQTPKTAFPLITLCHNPDLDESILGHHIIRGNSLNTFEVSNKRPAFKEGNYFKAINANKAYSQKSQKETIAKLVGSDSLASKYIDASKSYYFARGHLCPDGDMVHIYEQNASYYYLNVVPQWQSINNGNWKALEMAVRKYAVDSGVNLQVWTGTRGILKLDDNFGNPIPIYLAQDSSGTTLRLPAPEITWKVIHEPVKKLAVVIFIINNPHLQEVGQDLILCPDICPTISWVKWKTKTISKGYTYCCDLKSAKNFIRNVPNLGKVKLLS